MQTPPKTRRPCTGIRLAPLGLLALAAGAWGADFNGDQKADLAVGVPLEDIGSSLYQAGGLNVLYGSETGISAVGNQFWMQSDLIVTEGSELEDKFAYALAAGDFDGDGEYDLAVGVSGEDLGTADGAGAVQVLYGGSPGGLGAAGTQLWHQDSPGIPGAAESGDGLGFSLAAGDFDGDGFADLAVGVPSEDIGSIQGAGAVNVLYGSVGGLTASGSQIWYEGYGGLGGDPEHVDTFGEALAAGDFDRDGYDDLAIGIPGQTVLSSSGAGSVIVLYGSPGGLSWQYPLTWTQVLFWQENSGRKTPSPGTGSAPPSEPEISTETASKISPSEYLTRTMATRPTPEPCTWSTGLRRGCVGGATSSGGIQGWRKRPSLDER